MNMKHYFSTTTLLGILAIAGVLAGCKREQGVSNPNYNPEAKEVLTDFVLNVSTGQSPQTRMSADNVQKNSNFLGIQNAHLFAYATGNSSPLYVTSPDGTGFKKDFDLGTLYAAGSVDDANNKTNRILQLSVPTGTDAMLFYGKAITNDDFGARGGTEASISTIPSETRFKIRRRIGDDNEVEKYDATARLMIYMINQIIDSYVPAMTASDPAYLGYSGLPLLSWKDLGHQYERNLEDVPHVVKKPTDPEAASYTEADLADYNSMREDIRDLDYRSLFPLEEVMGRLYYLFTHFDRDGSFAVTEKFRAGSSNAVLYTMSSMDAQISRAASTTPTGPEEANAHRLAARISTVMKKYFDQDSQTSDWEYKNIATIKSDLGDDVWAAQRFEGARDINDYPGSFHIPEGAAQLSFVHNATDQAQVQQDYGMDVAIDHFFYLHPNNALVTPNKTFEPRKYVYPAELYYYVNSGLRVTDTEVTASDFPNGVEPWLTGEVASENKWTAGAWLLNGKVTSSTRGVAVRDNIEYGVALLQTNVQWATNLDPSNPDEFIYDNRSQHSSDDDRSIKLDEVNLELHGILVGGVHPIYDWQFLPIDASAEAASGIYGTFDGVIYDDQIVASAIPTPANQETYTLVYDNYNWAKAANEQNDVYVTLELVNKGDSFWGRDNIIPSGGTFYLVGLLKADGSNSNAQLNWANINKYAQNPPIYLAGDTVPSGKSAGMSKEVPRVFIQNVMTKVTFRIGKNSLKNAYYSIPDLKSAQMALGLSVDLTWQDGYDFDIVF